MEPFTSPIYFPPNIPRPLGFRWASPRVLRLLGFPPPAQMWLDTFLGSKRKLLPTGVSPRSAVLISVGNCIVRRVVCFADEARRVSPNKNQSFLSRISQPFNSISCYVFIKILKISQIPVFPQSSQNIHKSFFTLYRFAFALLNISLLTSYTS